MAELADLYVNDAFSCSHRFHASINKITEIFTLFAGLQLETEINALKKVTSEIKTNNLYNWRVKNFNQNWYYKKFIT